MPLYAWAAASVVVGWLGGCGAMTVADSAPSGSANPNAGQGTAPPALCPLCVTDNDCHGGGVCAQFSGDIFCAPPCPKGDECSPDRACTVVTTAMGDQASVCIPKNDACGPTVAPGGPDAGGGSCGSLVPPTTAADCKSCSSSAKTCQPNGCYGGWYCDTTTKQCHAPPATCSTPGDGGGGLFDADTAPISGQVGANGGTASRLFFAVVGDTRPAVNDDTSAYPTAIITKIYADLAAMTPAPLFAVSTGDYMFASPGNGEADAQLDKYLGARKPYPGTLFPAMGNHECTGATAGNCAGGTSSNMTAFMTKLLGPIGKSLPYYAINVSSDAGAWTAKLVFIAANAWDAAQASWLDATLAQPTTYTFVVRHEPRAANSAPGVTPSEQIMAQHPYTLAIVGHTHTYGRSGSKQVTIGNGGAPLTGSGNYGYGLVTQRSDGAIQVDMIDYQTGRTDAAFQFAVSPDGSPAP